VGGRDQLRDGLPLLGQLGEVAPPELVPVLRIVAERLAQLIARGELLEPAVELERVAAHAARPEPIDEEALPVVGGGRLIDALHADVVAALGHAAATRCPRGGAAPRARRRGGPKPGYML